MTEHSQYPTGDFCQRLRTFDRTDLRGVVQTLTNRFRPYMGNLDGERRLVFTDLQQAGRNDATVQQRQIALWRVLPYLRASDADLGTLTQRPVWKFLVEESHRMGFISDAEMLHYKMNPNQYLRGETGTGRANGDNRRTSSHHRDWAGSIGDVVSDFADDAAGPLLRGFGHALSAIWDAIIN